MEIEKALEIVKTLYQFDMVFIEDEMTAMKTLCEHVENNLMDDGK